MQEGKINQNQREMIWGKTAFTQCEKGWVGKDIAPCFFQWHNTSHFLKNRNLPGLVEKRGAAAQAAGVPARGHILRH